MAPKRVNAVRQGFLTPLLPKVPDTLASPGIGPKFPDTFATDTFASPGGAVSFALRFRPLRPRVSASLRFCCETASPFGCG